MKRLGKSLITAARYRSLRIPLGVFVSDSRLDWRTASIGQDVTIRSSKIQSHVSIGSHTRVVSSACGTSSKLGTECLLSESTLEEFAQLQDRCRSEASTIGKASYLASRTEAQNLQLGAFSSIGPDCLIGPAEHPISWLSTSPHFYGSHFRQSPFQDPELKFDEYAPVIIGADVWVGAKVIIRAGVTIGHGAVVAAGAVVVKDVEPYTIVGGVPAKAIRLRFPETDVAQLLELQWWDWPNELIAKAGKALSTGDFETLWTFAAERKRA